MVKIFEGFDTHTPSELADSEGVKTLIIFSRSCAHPSLLSHSLTKKKTRKARAEGGPVRDAELGPGGDGQVQRGEEEERRQYHGSPEGPSRSVPANVQTHTLTCKASPLTCSPLGRVRH
eukprot:1230590-Rhodomonas_salina.1